MSFSAAPAPHTKSKKLFFIYAKPGCPYSSDAVKLLTSNKFPPPKYTEVHALSSLDDLRKYVAGDDERKQQDVKFPQVFLKSKHRIGGYDELVKFFQRYNDEVADSDSETGGSSSEEEDDDVSHSGSGSD